MAGERETESGEKRAGSIPPRKVPAILIVDDNRDFAENLAEVVEDMGYPAEVALSGREALDRFVERAFPVAVIDLHLPDMSGNRVISRLKELSPDCHCIVFTGNAALGNAIEALNRGAFAYLVKGGEVDEFRAILRKALESHATVSELKQIRGINKAILESFPARMLVLDEEGRVLFGNAFPQPPLLPGPAVEGRRFEDLFPPGLPAADEVLRRYREFRLTGQLVDVPRLATEESGEARFFRFRLVPLYHSVARCLAVLEDITRTVRMEGELERSARLAAMGQMAASIAHEVRNPLSGISGAVQVLRRRFAEGSTEWEICDQVVAQVDRLNKSIEDLLVLARPMTPRMVSTSMADLLESTLSFLREDVNLKRVEFEVVAGEADRCRLDPFLFRQALLNVLLNAAQSMEGEGKVTVSVCPDRNRLQVKVRDRGPGFPEDHSRLFEPFFTTKPAGTGLGLPITAKILEVHGGSVSLRNHEEGGAEVVLTLPLEGSSR